MLPEAERLRRDRAIALLRALVAGKLTNDEFEDRFVANLDPRPRHEWDDRTLWAIRTQIWKYWNDLKAPHRLEGPDALSPEVKKFIARWILFLQTDHSNEWRRTDITLGSFFKSPARALRWLSGGRWQPEAVEDLDVTIWPFYRAEDLAAAKLRPR